MSQEKPKRAREPADGGGAPGACSQFGALCYRMRAGKVEVLLITSRRTARWIVPKGWPIPDASPADTAATEAFEEAGAVGEIGEVCLGLYTYDKITAEAASVPCVVGLFPLQVTGLKRTFPESGERRRKWVSRKRAASMVEEPELAAILAHFDPAQLAG